MSGLSKRATVYLDPELHRVLKIKAAETSCSMSELVNRAVWAALAEDARDLAVIEERVLEPVVSFEEMLKDLKKSGRI